MWNAIVCAGGWGLFFGVILLWVCSVVRERAYFNGHDPEPRHPEQEPTERALDGASADPRMSQSYAAPVRRPD